MQIVVQKPTTPSLASVLDLPNRLVVKRSPAYELLAGNVEKESTIAGVKRLMDPATTDRVVLALRSIDIELTPSDDGEVELATITALVTRFLRTAGGTMTPAARKEFLDGAVDELATLPFLLIQEPLTRACWEVDYAPRLLVWVMGQIREKLARLTEERRLLNRLLEIADHRG